MRMYRYSLEGAWGPLGRPFQVSWLCIVMIIGHNKREYQVGSRLKFGFSVWSMSLQESAVCVFEHHLTSCLYKKYKKRFHVRWLAKESKTEDKTKQEWLPCRSHPAQFIRTKQGLKTVFSDGLYTSTDIPIIRLAFSLWGFHRANKDTRSEFFDIWSDVAKEVVWNNRTYRQSLRCSVHSCRAGRWPAPSHFWHVTNGGRLRMCHAKDLRSVQ